jgi:HK97 family phage portal protein
MLRKAIEQRTAQTWHVSQTPPGSVIKGWGWNTYTGKDITEESALTVSAVYACIRGIAETTSTLPKILYRRLKDGGKERATDHPLYSILHDAINPEHTAQVGWELGQGHALAWGNAFYQIIRNQAGNVAQLWPLRPDRMTKNRKGGEVSYEYRQANGELKVFPANEIMHVPGFGFDGLVGYSPIYMARNAITVSMAAEEFGGKFFANDARPGVVLTTPKTLSEAAIKRLTESWNEEHKGSENSHKTRVLEEGMALQEIGIPPEDAQFLQTRAFQVAEIARFYRYPLALLEEHDKAATYASVEQFMLSFVIHTIRPWLVRFEQGINKSLLTPEERKLYFCETLVDGLLRGDLQSRYQAYATARQWGWMSADDILEIENRNPLPKGQGKIYLIPMNMAPASSQRNFAPVVAESAERIARREIHDLREAIRKIEKKGEGSQVSNDENFGAWLEKFYIDHEDFIERALQPLAMAYSGIVNMKQPPEVNLMARDYVQNNLATLRGFTDIEGMNGILDQWEQELPALLTQMFFKNFQEVKND